MQIHFTAVHIWVHTVCFGGVWGRIAWRWKRKLGKKANSRGKVKTGNLSFKPLKIDRWLQFDSLTWLKYRFLFFDICCTSHGKSVMAKSPGLAITKEREMGKCDGSCPPPAAPAPHPHPPPHIQQMLRFRKFTTAPQMSTVRSGKNLRMVRMWIVDMHPAPPVVWHLHISRGFDVYTLLVSKLVFNFIAL